MRSASLREQVGRIEKALEGDERLSIPIGLAWADHPESVQAVIDHADQEMYKEKERYHQEKVAREAKSAS